MEVFMKSKKIKLIALLLIFVLVLPIFIACDKTDDSSSAGIQKEATEPDIKYADLIPNPNTIFSNGNITITDPDGGTAYKFQVTNFTIDEYTIYVSECKNMGFNDVSYENSHDDWSAFGAYTSDKKYWVQVNLDSDNIIYVICQTSNN